MYARVRVLCRSPEHKLHLGNLKFLLFVQSQTRGLQSEELGVFSSVRSLDRSTSRSIQT